MKKLILLVMLLMVIPLVYGGTVSSSFTIKSEYVTITLLNQEPDPVEPGEIVELRFSIQNIGDKNAENFEMEVVPEFPFSMYTGDVVKSLGTIFARQMGETKTRIVYYKLKISEDAIDGDNDLYIKYRYDQGLYKGTWIKSGDPIKIRIRPREPILSIISVDTLPLQIGPGKKGILEIELQSMVNSVVKNVKATLDISELPFVPLGSSNEKVIKYIGPNEKAVLSFDLVPEADIVSKYYKIPLKLEYYVNGQNYEKTSYIGIEINEVPDMYAKIDYSEVYEGGVGTISIQFVNKGVSNLKFLNVVLKEDVAYYIVSSDIVYVGNIDSDDYENADFEIFVRLNEPFIYVPIEYTFLDANNNKYEESVQLKVKVYTSSEAKSLGFKQRTNRIGIVIVLVVVGGGIYWYIKKRRKSKALKTLKK